MFFINKCIKKASTFGGGGNETLYVIQLPFGGDYKKKIIYVG